MTSDTQQKKRWTNKGLLEWTSNYFTEAHLDQPRLCAELFLAHVLECQRIDLYVRFDECPGDEQLARFRALVKRAADQEPAAYIIGKAHFYSLDFEVSPAVLIPRPETEILVAQAIDFCRRETVRPTVDVLDLCTGSGCVAGAIAFNVVETEIIALDSSAAALEIARKNIEKHDLTGRVTLLESDLFKNIAQADKCLFDLIVANPPYISAVDYEKLPRHIRDYEPDDALRGGPEGLDVIEAIIAQAQPYLADQGALMMEIAYDQAQPVIALCQNCGYLTDIKAHTDHQGHKRVITARRV